MRKILSLVMVLAMVLSCASLMAVSSSASVFDEWGYEEWPEGFKGKKKGYQAVEALYFESEPTIDGSITEAEWGEVTRKMTSAQASNYNESSSLYASYFYWNGVVTGAEYTGAGIEYDLWLRWDENYFYVGVKVRDYDGHSLKHGLNNTWNGDAIQFRVDKDYNFADTGRDRLNGWSDKSTIPNVMCGYSQVAGGFVECYDDANASTKGLTAYSNPKWGAAKVAVAPAGDKYSDDTAAGYTTYEVALPWKYVFENGDYMGSGDNTPYTLAFEEWDGEYKSGMGGIGVELGMSLVTLNAAEGASSYNSYLTWGSGVAGANSDANLKKYNQKANTCTGANLVFLSDATVDPAAGNFKKYDPSKLDRAGSVGGGNYDKKFKDYLTFDFDKTVAKDKITTLTYDSADDMLYWGNDVRFHGSIRNVGGEHGNVLVFDRAIAPYDINGNDKKGVEGGPDVFTDKDPIPSFYIEASGVDEFSVWNFPTSYTLEFDVRYLSNDRAAEGRESVLATWFGGADGVSYQCGYSFADRQFIICPSQRETEKMASKNFDLVQNQWYNWKFQFDNETCTVRLLIDDEVIFNVYNRYFYYSSESHQENGTSVYAWFINTQVEFDNVKIYNFYDYVNKDAGGVQEPVGGGTVQKPSTEVGGGNVDTDVQVKDDKFVVEVSAKDVYKTATELSYTFTMNAEKYEFVGLEGLAENAYKVEEKDGKYTITIVDLSVVKSAKDGEKLFDLVFKAKAEGADGSDLDLDLKDEFKYTVVTGDTMVWMIAFATLMVVSAAAVVVYKKRRAADLI